MAWERQDLTFMMIIILLLAIINHKFNVTKVNTKKNILICPNAKKKKIIILYSMVCKKKKIKLNYQDMKCHKDMWLVKEMNDLLIPLLF